MGKNKISNRLDQLSGKIKYTDLDMTRDSFKKKCKALFIEEQLMKLWSLNFKCGLKCFFSTHPVKFLLIKLPMSAILFTILFVKMFFAISDFIMFTSNSWIIWLNAKSEIKSF